MLSSGRSLKSSFEDYPFGTVSAGGLRTAFRGSFPSQFMALIAAFVAG
jgi:hypothetical protein